jgi:hypothetical protein
MAGMAFSFNHAKTDDEQLALRHPFCRFRPLTDSK